MKRIVATIGMVAIAGSCFAQGTVGFANNASTLVKQVTSVSDSTPINAPATTTRVEFLWAVDGTTEISAFSAVNGVSPLALGPVAGRFSTPTAITVPGIAAGGIVSAVVRGWTGGFASYNEALTAAQANAAASFLGYSGIFRVDTGDPTAIPAGTPGNIVTSISGQGFAGVTLVAIPEPSTFALAGLGAAAMLIFRRRK